MKVTAIKRQVKRPNRLSIYIDDKFAFGLSETGLLQSAVVVGQELTAAEQQALKTLSVTDKAYDMVLRYTALRPHSTWEVENYLRRKGVIQDTIDLLLQRLSELNLTNDVAFAESWVNYRKTLKPTSQRKLRMELQQKRVPRDIIDRILENNSGDDQIALRQLIAKKQQRYPDKTKFMQYLVRQGFSYDDVRSALC